MFKVNNKDTRTIPFCAVWRRSGVFIVNFEHILRLVLVFLLLTLRRQMLIGIYPNGTSDYTAKDDFDGV